MARNPYDGSPEYTEPLAEPAYVDDFTTCTECGAIVRERWQAEHNGWHRLIWNEA